MPWSLYRAVFCPLSSRPYEDAPQNLGWNATITSPYMVETSHRVKHRSINLRACVAWLTVIACDCIGELAWCVKRRQSRIRYWQWQWLYDRGNGTHGWCTWPCIRCGTCTRVNATKWRSCQTVCTSYDWQWFTFLKYVTVAARLFFVPLIDLSYVICQYHWWSMINSR